MTGESALRWKLSTFLMALNGLLLAYLIHRHLFTTKTLREANDQEAYGTVAKDLCSGHGELQSGFDTLPTACLCHHGFTGRDCSILDRSCLIDINQGDPKIFEKYWLQKGEDSATKFSGWEGMSYYSDSKQFFFVQTQLDKVIRSVHEVVGNAITEGRHIVIGTGSTQLFQAALYGLSSASSRLPKKVVAQAPYYSGYPAITDYLKSSLYYWAGDATKFKHEEEGDSYIELVTTPNNPSGELRNAVVNGSAVIHDLAYYWPHYTPITSPVDEEIMLFTLSKSTGHAGTRIGWAIVKDSKLAQRMAKFIELNTLGVSKDAQLRAVQILRSVANEKQGRFVPKTKSSLGELGPQENSLSMDSASRETNALFHFGAYEMENRWTMLRGALQQSLHFRIPDFQPAVCTFLGERRSPTPGFAWLECLQEDDCERFLRQHNILARGGGSFGADPRFVRLSMLDRRGTFEALVDRLKCLDEEA